MKSPSTLFTLAIVSSSLLLVYGVEFNELTEPYNGEVWQTGRRCAFRGKTIAFNFGDEHRCRKLCEKKTGCTHYNHSGKFCWMKGGDQGTAYDVNVKVSCGYRSGVFGLVDAPASPRSSRESKETRERKRDMVKKWWDEATQRTKGTTTKWAEHVNKKKSFEDSSGTHPIPEEDFFLEDHEEGEEQNTRNNNVVNNEAVPTFNNYIEHETRASEDRGPYGPITAEAFFALAGNEIKRHVLESISEHDSSLSEESNDKTQDK